MHYKNGRPAKNGDKVLLLAAYGAPMIGILYDAQAGNDYCNGKLAPVSPLDVCPNLKECVHIDDVQILPYAATHQDRVRAELAEVSARRKKLGEFIKESPVFASLPAVEQDLLREQELAMAPYISLLQARVNYFDGIAAGPSTPPVGIATATPATDADIAQAAEQAR